MVLALRAACGGPNSIRSNLSLLVQRKETKRKHASERATSPLRSSPHRALANSPGAHYAPRARTRFRLKAPGGAAVLGALRGLEDPSCPISLTRMDGRMCFKPPAWRTRAPQGFGQAPRRGRAQGRLAHEARSLVCQRRAPKPRRRGLKCVIRGGLFFGRFLLAGQKKATCRGSATHKYSSYSTIA